MSEIKRPLAPRTGTVTAKDKTVLFFRHYPMSFKRASILLIHGFAEHSGRYGHLIQFLQEHDFEVLGIDLRGHGYSSGKRGVIQSLSDYEHDIEAGLSFLQTSSNQKPIFLLAHSMGGMLALYFAQTHSAKLSGLALSCPLLELKMRVPAWKKVMGKMASRFLPELGMKSDVKGFQLTSDENLARAYDTDPLVLRYATTRWFSEIMRVPKDKEKLAQINIPVLLQLGSEDPLVDSEASLKWFDTLRASDRTLQCYEGFRHEIYNETERMRPIGDLKDWLLKRSPISL